ncbi:MAG: hypothetical protein U0Y68_23935 [Blastocatellia bacterium]
MTAINHAHDVLIDPEHRRLYDATGSIEKQTPLDEEARRVTTPPAKARRLLVPTSPAGCLTHKRGVPALR